jgi:CDP-diacylglycerol---glycerol-3-phosphate 3-phosphatidyltransferase
LTIPNLLTLLRVALIVPFCFFVTGGLQWDVMALLTFVVAAFTDWFDGYYARRFKQLSDAGKLLDPLADKLLVATAFIAFAADPVVRLPVWTVVLIMGREFLITGLRALVISHGAEVMAADTLGKAKTVAQMACILVFLVGRAPHSEAFLALGMAIYSLAVFLTVLSGLEYLWRYRIILLQSFRANPEQ